MKVIVAGRSEGKTERMLKWLREAPEGEHRVIVTPTLHQAMDLYRRNHEEFESWQFVGEADLQPGAWSGVIMGRGGRIVLGIDNLDTYVQSQLRWEIGAVSLTDGERDSHYPHREA